ncbi:MAG: prepilin-type N-terminal cleavage/methylation domain-containing protein [Beijerinckiaceae bacterium]|nr:prepilin-type N-terminal cleavage/methylation domain-containing protein [Beijerinckiaceae bacterium]MCI0736100.1 prepilin-type N-terminal cleavage/methylation domain-containing protein [Beijerinckiaceae bacterium]
MNKRLSRAVRLRTGECGFTLLEALIAAALTGLVLTMIATVATPWMQSWKAGFGRTQNADLLGLGLDRLAADLGAAEFVSPGKEGTLPLFLGRAYSVTFVRSAIGPNAPAGLEIVRLAETDDARGRVLVRARIPFTPVVTAKAIDAGLIEFSNPVVLVRPPYRVSFAFAGNDRVWRDTWLDAIRLPEAVRITVHDAETGQILPVTTAALLNVNAPAECVANPTPACGGQQGFGQHSGGQQDGGQRGGAQTRDGPKAGESGRGE